MIAALKQYLIEIIAGAALVLGCYITYEVMHARLQTAQIALHAAQDRVDALTLAAQARDAGDAVRERQRTLADTKLKETQYELRKALAANPGWASQPVPGAVLDSLRGAARSGSTPAAQ